ncbi:sodium-extruding oxaloacetate decarboxylase subunit alpha [Alcanivorax sp. 1008]|uniref:sodium-extruding oxaloacetate decarboxylase subunit alpha n=1 Tax=Alcanivorax sp. 1008 TaxID=2816853 RepID=UPI001D1F0E57|nr:sodium-extruding oxaloacetate decarboxylase subunit alpha [Alcanivorax sp. 1008]MCC1497607.1 sodium-extruding oxaloacetate decarboxylase subunit alpha [Alcanivorax sp. 1008]
MNKKPLGITDVVLRDAHQSLFATRLRLDDMLPIAAKLDQVGFWSVESWGGATFDACIRYLGEDPWDRIRELKKAMPNTRQQMLLRGQNLLGYRHYADDVVDRFVERAAKNGVDVFRVFDAMNDPRNLERAIAAVIREDKHAQGTLSYTNSPVHTLEAWIDLAKKIEDMGAHSIAIKDMAGLLRPYEAFELVSRLKQTLAIPVQLHCHATTGLSTATIVKAVEAGIDTVDTAISSMSMTYGHSPTEAVVSIFEGTDRDTGLNIHLLEEVAAYFREVRKKYAKFEGSLRGVDSRILVAQVPGGMLTNMEGQLKEQNAEDKFDAVLAEIPKVREDLGFIPLVTPTSQIVGTQAVLNVLSGERYKAMSKETRGILRGEYGSAPAPFNAELQARALDGDEPITCRPADLISNEMDKLSTELDGLAKEKGIKLAHGEQHIDDVLTYALFPQIGLKFLQNRGNPKAFEPVPTGHDVPTTDSGEEIYTVTVDGQNYSVTVAAGGDVTGIAPVGGGTAVASAPAGAGEPLNAPLAGNIFRVLVKPGQQVAAGEKIIVLEAMKMETDICAPRAGTVIAVQAKEGDAVTVGDLLLTIG